MEDCCFKADCKRKVSVKCSCSLQISSCSKHIGKHLTTLGSLEPHNISTVAVILNKTEMDNQLSRARKLLIYLDYLKRETQELSLNLVNFITKQSKTRLENIKKLKNLIKNITLSAQSSDLIKLSELSRFESIHHEKNTKDLVQKKQMFKTIEKVFSLPCDKVLSKYQSDKFIFYPIIFQNNIDVYNVKKNLISTKIVRGGPVVSNRCLCCRISETKYFIHGGQTKTLTPSHFAPKFGCFSEFNSPFNPSMNNSSFSSNIASGSQLSNSLFSNPNTVGSTNNFNSIFSTNIKQNKNRTVTQTMVFDLKNWTTKGISSSLTFNDASGCYINNCVYVFGGNCEYNKPLHECKKFCFGRNEWENLVNLPIPCHSTTASAFDGFIWVTGFNLPNLIRFDLEKGCFESFYDLGENCFKYVFDEFVIVDNAMLGIIQENKVENIGPISVSIGSLLIGTCFKKKGFYYFVNSKFNILRIDVKLKKIIKCN